MKTVIMLLFMLPLAIAAQDIKTTDKLALTDTLIFLGVDLSQTRMISPAEVDNGAALKDKHGPEWATIDDVMCERFPLKMDLHKKKVICRQELLEKSYQQMDSLWITDKYAGITETQIAQHIKTYPKVDGGYKLGLVFIVDIMNAEKKVLNMYAAYIDLSDNSVLATFNCIGGPDGIGYSRYWTTAIDNAYQYFLPINLAYLQKVKRTFKKKKEDAPVVK